MSTANPTYLAYYTEANRNGNIDVVYPYYRLAEKDIDGDREFWANLDNALTEGFYDWINLIIESGACHGYRCVMLSLKQALADLEVCGTEAHNIGYDSPDGRTWTEFEQKDR